MNVPILKLMSVTRIRAQHAKTFQGAMSVYVLFHGVNQLTTSAVGVSSTYLATRLQ